MIGEKPPVKVHATAEEYAAERQAAFAKEVGEGVVDQSFKDWDHAQRHDERLRFKSHTMGAERNADSGLSSDLIVRYENGKPVYSKGFGGSEEESAGQDAAYLAKLEEMAERDEEGRSESAGGPSETSPKGGNKTQEKPKNPLEQLLEENKALRAENQQLRAIVKELIGQVEALGKEVEQLRQELKQRAEEPARKPEGELGFEINNAEEAIHPQNAYLLREAIDKTLAEELKGLSDNDQKDPRKVHGLRRSIEQRLLNEYLKNLDPKKDDIEGVLQDLQGYFMIRKETHSRLTFEDDSEEFETGDGQEPPEPSEETPKPPEEPPTIQPGDTPRKRFSTLALWARNPIRMFNIKTGNGAMRTGDVVVKVYNYANGRGVGRNSNGEPIVPAVAPGKYPPDRVITSEREVVREKRRLWPLVLGAGALYIAWELLEHKLWGGHSGFKDGFIVPPDQLPQPHKAHEHLSTVTQFYNEHTGRNVSGMELGHGWDLTQNPDGSNVLHAPDGATFTDPASRGGAGIAKGNFVPSAKAQEFIRQHGGVMHREGLQVEGPGGQMVTRPKTEITSARV